ncbi:hypothetical protein WDW89_08540 [Deltaproteobacteria bacterium TL4]
MIALDSMIKIKKMSHFLTVCIVSFLLMSSQLWAKNRRTEFPLQLQIVGSIGNFLPLGTVSTGSIGGGLSTGYHLTSWFYLGMEYYELNKRIDNSRDEDFKTLLGITRIFPFDNLGLYFQGGIAIRNWRKEVRYLHRVQLLEKEKWSNTAGNYGIGWNIINSARVSLSYGINNITGESSQLTEIRDLSGTRTEEEIQMKTNNYKPETQRIYHHLGIGWNF